MKKQIVSTTPSPYNAVLQQNLLTALMIQQAMDLTHRVYVSLSLNWYPQSAKRIGVASDLEVTRLGRIAEHRSQKVFLMC